MDGLTRDGKKAGVSWGRKEEDPDGILLCRVTEKTILCIQADVKQKGTRLLPISTSSSTHLAHASVWSTAACTCVVYKTQSWKAGSCGGVGQSRPAGSQLLMWLAAWLAPLRCWQDGEICWPQATTVVGRMPPSRAFLLPLSSGAQWARALDFQFFRLAAGAAVRLSFPPVGSPGQPWLGVASLIKGTVDLGFGPVDFC